MYLSIHLQTTTFPLTRGNFDEFSVVALNDAMHCTVVCDDHVFHGIIPETEVDELAEEPGADDLEFTGEDTASVNVAM